MFSLKCVRETSRSFLCLLQDVGPKAKLPRCPYQVGDAKKVFHSIVAVKRCRDLGVSDRDWPAREVLPVC